MRIKLLIILIVWMLGTACPAVHANAKTVSGNSIETVTVLTTEEPKPSGTPEPTETPKPSETPEPMSEELDIEKVGIKQFLKIFVLGLCSGLGLVTILYMLGIAIGSFFAIVKMSD